MTIVFYHFKPIFQYVYWQYLVYWEETDAINEQGAEMLFADNETISRYSHIPAEIT
jgi:hypothetical protein